jgi:hypothetical protein
MFLPDPEDSPSVLPGDEDEQCLVLDRRHGRMDRIFSSDPSRPETEQNPCVWSLRILGDPSPTPLNRREIRVHAESGNIHEQR